MRTIKQTVVVLDNEDESIFIEYEGVKACVTAARRGNEDAGTPMLFISASPMGEEMFDDDSKEISSVTVEPRWGNSPQFEPTEASTN